MSLSEWQNEQEWEYLPETIMVYVGVKKCGCTVAATVDTPDNQKYVPKDLKNFANSGLTIKRIPIEEARRILRKCKCGTNESLF